MHKITNSEKIQPLLGYLLIFKFKNKRNFSKLYTFFFFKIHFLNNLPFYVLPISKTKISKSIQKKIIFYNYLNIEEIPMVQRIYITLKVLS